MAQRYIPKHNNI